MWKWLDRLLFGNSRARANHLWWKEVLGPPKHWDYKYLITYKKDEKVYRRRMYSSKPIHKDDVTFLILFGRDIEVLDVLEISGLTDKEIEQAIGSYS